MGKILKAIIYILMLLVSVCALSAQSAERFIQRLSWEAEEFASGYEVVIERLINEGTEEVLREQTDQAFLYCSLSAGRYRYQVRVYNLFGRPEVVSNWAMFEIIPATREGYLYRFSWLPIAQASRYEVVVQQRTADRRYQEILRKATLAPFIDCVLPEAEYRYQVIMYNLFDRPEVTSDWVAFEVVAPPPEVAVAAPPAPEQGDIKLDVPEEPELAVELESQPDQNPEPEAAPESEPQVEPVPMPEPQPKPEPQPGHRLPDIPPFIVQAAYTPLIPLQMGFLNTFYDTRFFLAGASARVAFLPFRSAYNGFGLEMTPAWTYIIEETDLYTTAAHFMSVHLNLLYQQRLPGRKFAFSFRLGGGVSLFHDFYIQYRIDEAHKGSDFWNFSLDGGLSFQWFISEPLFIEIGGDFIYLFSKDVPPPMYIRPFLGVGIQF